MRAVEIAAVQIFDGRYELLRVDLPEAAGELSDRISSLDRVQFEVAARHLLPALEANQGTRKLLSGAVVVRLKDWRALK